LYALDPLTQIDPVGLMGNAPGTYGRPGGSTRPPSPNIGACSYYSQVFSQFGCAYHSFAYGVCRGEEPIVNVLSSLITSPQLNCIRRCLIENDKQARADPNCRTNCGRGNCTKKSCIDRYHSVCFTQCNALGGDLLYGGKYGDYPNDGDQ
jgi:hypothetical protein